MIFLSQKENGNFFIGQKSDLVFKIILGYFFLSLLRLRKEARKKHQEMSRKQKKHHI